VIFVFLIAPRRAAALLREMVYISYLGKGQNCFTGYDSTKSSPEYRKKSFSPPRRSAAAQESFFFAASCVFRFCGS